MTKIVADANKELMDKISGLAPIIIIGLIWLFSAIAKVVAGKKGEQPQMEQKAKGKPAQPGFNDLIKLVRQKYAQSQEQIRKESEQGAKRIESPAQSSVEGPAQPSRPKPATAPPMPQYKPSVTHDPGQSYGPRYIPLTEKPASPSLVHKIGPHSYLGEILKQYSKPDGLRKAFLNYEIFGKPIALRESIQSMF